MLCCALIHCVVCGVQLERTRRLQPDLVTVPESNVEEVILWAFHNVGGVSPPIRHLRLVVAVRHRRNEVVWRRPCVLPGQTPIVRHREPQRHRPTRWVPGQKQIRRGVCVCVHRRLQAVGGRMRIHISVQRAWRGGGRGKSSNNGVFCVGVGAPSAPSEHAAHGTRHTAHGTRHTAPAPGTRHTARTLR